MFGHIEQLALRDIIKGWNKMQRELIALRAMVDSLELLTAGYLAEKKAISALGEKKEVKTEVDFFHKMRQEALKKQHGGDHGRKNAG